MVHRAMEEDDSMAAWHWREGRTARKFVLGAAQRHVLEAAVQHGFIADISLLSSCPGQVIQRRVKSFLSRSPGRQLSNSGLLSRHEQMRVYSWAVKTAVQHGIHVAVCADSSLLSRQDSYSTCCRQLTPASCPDQVMCRRVESFLLGGHSLSLKGTVKMGGTPGLAEVSDEHQEA
ncbi:uncharacterized protein LOC144927500 [Branchiostoma floridae x Branchiostoma belcheri]